MSNILLMRVAPSDSMQITLSVDHGGPTELKLMLADTKWEIHFRQHDRTQLVQ